MRHLPVRSVTRIGIQAGWIAAKEARAASSSVTKSWSAHNWLSDNLGLTSAGPLCLTSGWIDSDEYEPGVMGVLSGTVLTRELRVVEVKRMSRGEEVVVSWTVVRVVGCKSREELTVTRVTVMLVVSKGKMLVLIFSGISEEFQRLAVWSGLVELTDKTETTRGTSTEMLDT
jgi:hypothetical protein